MAKGKKPIEQYEHLDKMRKNNPPAGLVTPETDRDGEKKAYAYDPHLDPQLTWAGKIEHTFFEVPTVSLHVHERIDPHTIVEAVERRDGEVEMEQPALFETPEENPPLRQAIDFYQHEHSWSNRMIAGDSLLVMNSLLEKEALAGQVQMVYIDPPYGIKYGSNFQPFVNRREVKDGKDADLTQEPEMVRAFRDTWELGIHSYLTYLRDRLLLARELLSESGSVFVQISEENLHHVRELMDEVFGSENLANIIVFRKTAAVSSPMARVNVLAGTCDYVVWYAKDKARVKYRQLFLPKSAGSDGAGEYVYVDLNGERRKLTPQERRDPAMLPIGARLYRQSTLTSTGYSQELSEPFTFEDHTYSLSGDMHWKTTQNGLNRLVTSRRLERRGTSLAYVRYLDDFPVFPLVNVWMDTRACYEPATRRPVACWSKRQANATKWSPATVSGNLS